jgi:hypothetical protein
MPLNGVIIAITLTNFWSYLNLDYMESPVFSSFHLASLLVQLFSQMQYRLSQQLVNYHKQTYKINVSHNITLPYAVQVINKRSTRTLIARLSVIERILRFIKCRSLCNPVEGPLTRAVCRSSTSCTSTQI